MPEKLTLADGTEREVLTAEEQTALQEKAGQAESLGEVRTQFDAFKTELGIKEGENVLDKVKEIKESTNPNWVAARGKIARMEAVLTSKGLKVDGEGNLVDESGKPLTAAEVKTAATEAATEVLTKHTVETIKAQMMVNLTAEQLAAVDVVFKKLSAGEQMTAPKTQELVGQAMAAAGIPTGKTRPFTGGVAGSGAPMIEKKADSFADTDEGKQAGAAMGLSFTKEDKK